MEWARYIREKYCVKINNETVVCVFLCSMLGVKFARLTLICGNGQFLDN